MIQSDEFDDEGMADFLETVTTLSPVAEEARVESSDRVNEAC